jgi:CRISPR/Cas system endoribonuclease Cas6 (RAMP superfamily)
MKKKKKLNNWDISPTLEEFERRLKNRQKNSSTSEVKREIQPDDMITYEVRFVSDRRNKNN